MKRITGRFAGLRRRAGSLSPKALGTIVAILVVVATLSTFTLSRISTELGGGSSIAAEFDRGYKLEAYRSTVRIADVKVGKVQSVEPTGHGTVEVKMKISDDAREKLGSEPTATIKPTTLLGGIYYVQLAPGGTRGEFAGDSIPVSRTTTPVELDQVLTALDSDARAGLRTSITKLDGAMTQGGTKSLRRLVRTAPGTLAPTGRVAKALQGTKPTTDLTKLVSGLQTTAGELTRTDGQLAAIFTDLDKSTRALTDARVPLSQAFATLPASLRTTRTGLDDLDGTLGRLTTTADRLRPSAGRLAKTLADLDPVLVRARPVVNDARVLMGDARPLVGRLIPTTRRSDEVLGNVVGPVLDRVNGPIKDLVMSPWKGSGPYAGGGNSNLFYEEVGFLGVDGAKTFQTHDGNGAQGRLMAGVGLQTLSGENGVMSLEQYLETLGLGGPAGPQEFSDNSPIQLPDLGTLGGGR